MKCPEGANVYKTSNNKPSAVAIQVKYKRSGEEF